MRILYDSKQLQFKTPFGTLTPGEQCTLQMHVPYTVQAKAVECVIQRENGAPVKTTTLEFAKKMGAYEIQWERYYDHGLASRVIEHFISKPKKIILD
jgi:hypothetical protein